MAVFLTAKTFPFLDLREGHSDDHFVLRFLDFICF